MKMNWLGVALNREPMTDAKKPLMEPEQGVKSVGVVLLYIAALSAFGWLIAVFIVSLLMAVPWLIVPLLGVVAIGWILFINHRATAGYADKTYGD